MLKKSIIPGVFSGLFLTFSILYWYVVRRFYNDPFAWFKFEGNFDNNLIYLIFSTVGLIIFSSLLTIIRPKSRTSLGTYGLGALIQFIFLPFEPFLIVSMFVFFLGFWFYESGSDKIFHSYIKINFWDTYTKTIPGLLTFLTIVIAIVCYQAGLDKARTLKITVPERLIEQTIDFLGGGNIKGESTSINAPESTRTLAQSNVENTQADDATIEQILNEQLQKYGITDPVQQQLIKEQIKQMYGVGGTQSSESGRSPSPQQTTTAPPNPNDPVGGLSQQVQQEYRRLLIEQTKNEIERQLDANVAQYRPFIPVLNTIALFFLLSIINLPVMILSIPLVTGIMYAMRRYGLISIVKVKQDVERLAW